MRNDNGHGMLTTGQVAVLRGISIPSVIRDIEAGKLRAMETALGRLIWRDDADAYLAACGAGRGRYGLPGRAPKKTGPGRPVVDQQVGEIAA